MLPADPILTREQVRAVDRMAIEVLGIPGVVLMENAARGVAGAVLERIGARRGAVSGARAVVLCGAGNNGGDGWAVARLLHNAGLRVEVWSTCPRERLRGDAATERAVAEAMGLPFTDVAAPDELERARAGWEGAEVAVDALLGTGATGAPRELAAAAIRALNATRFGLVCAVDLPSGLDADRGTAEGAVVRADVTVTFVAAKPGLRVPAAAAYVGELIVADIGAPPELIARALSGER